MHPIKASSEEFNSLAQEILDSGHQFHFRARGSSMLPFIHDGDILVVTPLRSRKVKCGDIVLLKVDAGRLLAHRVIQTRWKGSGNEVLIKGDASRTIDGWFPISYILGKIDLIIRNDRSIDLNGWKLRFKSIIRVIDTFCRMA